MPTTRIFISYKTGVGNALTMQANLIYEMLRSNDYDVWMDVHNLVGSKEWTKQLYDAIPKSDILLLLLSKEAAESPYVRREVDVARGAQVTILPVLLREDFDLDAVLKTFDLPNIQSLRFLTNSEPEKTSIMEAIEQIKEDTFIKQQNWFKELRRRYQKEPCACNERYAAYELPDAPDECRLYLAAGDITEMQGIEVLVNSENTYMQMARIFETRSLSSKLRWHGAQKARNGHVREDTVQQELYEMVKTDPYMLPIQLGSVVPTHAGHKDSKLVENGARYIFHVATVAVRLNPSDDLEPATNADIRGAVTSCLNEVLQVDKVSGRISPENTARWAEEEAAAASYEAIKSIIFPLFASGRGGRETEADRRAITQTMLSSIRDFVSRPRNKARLKLKAIHLCAFSPEDATLVKAVMDNMFAPAPSAGN